MAIDKLAEALEQFVNTEDWDEGRRIVEENQDLLGDEALALLAESIADYRMAERDDIANYLDEHRNVLLRSRDIGIGPAFKEADQRATAIQEKRQQQLARLRPASPNPIQAFVWQLLDAASPQEVDRVLGEHPDEAQSQEAINYLDEQMQQARRAGYNEAVTFLREYHELLRSYYELPPLMRALQEFMSVPSWTESRQVLQNNPALLGDEALRTMDSLIAEARSQKDEATVQALEAYRQVLARAREVGPEQATEEVMARQEVPQ